VTTQAVKERNYHIFYYLLKAMPPADLEKYKLSSQVVYAFLNNSSQNNALEHDVNAAFQEVLVSDWWNLVSIFCDSEMISHAFFGHIFLQNSMEVLNFTDDEKDAVFRILASILKLGNLEFVSSPNTENPTAPPVTKVTVVEGTSPFILMSLWC
jgi:myosin heavy subunit